MRKRGVTVFVSEYKTITSVSWICCSFLWMSVYEILCAKEGLRYLFQNIKQLQMYHGFAVVFSGCLFTKSPIINERIDELNKSVFNVSTV